MFDFTNYRDLDAFYMIDEVIMENEHNGVQLWENGPYWATTNIGAERPEDYGYYFWWDLNPHADRQ